MYVRERFIEEVKRLADRVIIIGAGGHGKVIADILASSGAFEPVGFTDRGGGGFRAGLPVLGDDSALPGLLREGISHAFVAIGDNLTRKEATAGVRRLGFSLARAVSPHACISAAARLGDGVAVMPGAVINVDSRLGAGAIVNTLACVDHDNAIGAYAHVAPGCSLAGNVTVGEGAFVGIGSKAIPGVSIGEWSVIGAGSVVVEDIPPYSVAYGVPAQVVKRHNEPPLQTHKESITNG